MLSELISATTDSEATVIAKINYAFYKLRLTLDV